MEYVKLKNNVKMPIIGFGVYQVTDAEECERSVLDAIEAGYRLIDTAQAYQNEEAVGHAIKKSGIPRKDLFVTTKLWLSDYGKDKAERAAKKSLERLGLDYVDLYLLHQPFGDVFGSWRALEKLNKQGLLKSIGVSNFYPDQLMNLIAGNEIAPVVNQIEVNPFYQRGNEQQFLTKNNVQTEAWAPFAEGRNNLFTNEILTNIGNNYHKSVAQVILRWLIQRGIVALAKSTHKERTVENFNVFDFSLSDEEMSKISELDQDKSSFFSHRDPAVIKRFFGLNEATGANKDTPKS